MHPQIERALSDNRQERKNIKSAAKDVDWTASLIERHPNVCAEITMIQSSGTIAVTCMPDHMDNMGAFLREIRARIAPGARVSIKKNPESHSIRYFFGRWYIEAFMAKNCTFKQIGVETVEKPVYELACN